MKTINYLGQVLFKGAKRAGKSEGGRERGESDMGQNREFKIVTFENFIRDLGILKFLLWKIGN